MEEVKKSYNPFKMWGSWVGLCIAILGAFLMSTESQLADLSRVTLLFNPLIWIVGWPTLFVVYTTPVVLFFEGWAVHSIFRKLDRKNRIRLVVAIITLFVASQVFIVVQEMLTRKEVLSTSGDVIKAAKMIPRNSIRNSEDFTRERLAMNAVVEIARSEEKIPVLINKMISIAGDETLAMDVRLTALESLYSRVEKMNQGDKSMLSGELVVLESKIKILNELIDNERIAGRISMLQKLLSESK